MSLRVVGSGCDSLYYTVADPLAPSLIAELARERERAAAGDDVVRVLDGYPFAVQKTGADGGYRYLLVCEDVSGAKLYSIACTDVDNGAPVKVQLHSYALWFLGAWRAYRESITAVAALYDVDARKCGGRISRLDLCADFQGWDLSEGIDHARIVSRARGVHPYSEFGACRCGMQLIRDGARACPWCFQPYRELEKRLTARSHERAEKAAAAVESMKTYKARVVAFNGRAREVFTGWDWGSGKKIMIRIYNKTLEIKRKSKKYWFELIWSKSRDFVAHEPVWRVEIQLRREAFNDMRLGDGGLLRRVDSVENALNDAQSIWRYVVGGPNPQCKCGQFNESWRSRCVACAAPIRHYGGWFSLREPRGGDPEKWPADVSWRALQLVSFEGSQPATELVRPAHIVGQTSTLMRMGAGVIRSLAVTRGVVTMLDDRHERHSGCTPHHCAAPWHPPLAWFGAEEEKACTGGERLQATRVFDEGVRQLKEVAAREGLFDEEGDRKGRTFIGKAVAQDKRRRVLSEIEEQRVREIVPLHQRPSHEPRSISAIRYGWRPLEKTEAIDDGDKARPDEAQRDPGGAARPDDGKTETGAPPWKAEQTGFAWAARAAGDDDGDGEA